MRRLARVGSLLVLTLSSAACQRTEDNKPRVTKVPDGSGSGVAAATPTPTKVVAAPERPDPITPPVDLKTPPPDAIKTTSGLVYKKLESVSEGATAQRNDTVSLIYTGWRQQSGETFFSNRGKPPMALPLANTAAGFTEAMMLMKKGERAVMWLPPELSAPPASKAAVPSETLVYEVQLVDIQSAPKVPADLAAPPANALKLPSGTQYLVVKTGTGKEKPRAFDTVTFNYTAWDHEGRMFDTTEMRNRPATVPPYRQSEAMEEMLTSLTPGSRVRFWVQADRMQMGGKAVAGMPSGLLVYEIELVTITKGNPPPPVPPDVKAPPANAQKTVHGVAYRVLKAGGGGEKPTIDDTVKVSYTGWTLDGRMFDSTIVKGEPAVFPLKDAMTGWSEGIAVMSVGDRVRFWIPGSMAWDGAPGKPQGMLVFDVELVSFDHGQAEKPAPR